MTVRYVSSTAKCKCRNCDKTLEFDTDQAGQTVQCPSCGLETLLFIPPAIPLASEMAPSAVEKQARKNMLTVVFLIFLATVLTTIVEINDQGMRDDIPLIAMPFIPLFGGIVYFAPALAATKKNNFTAILLLNLLLGWTLLGWVGALVWAAVKDKPAAS